MVRKHLSAAYDYWVEVGLIEEQSSVLKKQILSTESYSMLKEALERVSYCDAEMAA